jgi:peroxiredoxin
MSIEVGKKAPDFTLKSESGEEITLSEELKNTNVVLLFFPLAFSGVCTKEMCYTRDHLEQFNNVNAKILGISVDSFFTLKEFKKVHELNFNLLSDFNKEVSKTYETIYDEFFGMHGVSKRSAFVIGKDGMVRYQEVLEDAGEQPDFNTITKTLSEL